MHRVIVNSTPLIVLSNINHLFVLQKLYKHIYIPQAVYDEVTAKHDSACEQIKDNLDWIHICKIKNEIDRRIYQAKLHDGEVEVMILAKENDNKDLLIIDDNAAKKTAKFLGLKVTGTLGVILKAKKENIIPNATVVMNQIIQRGFYISQDIYDLVKAEANE